MADILGNPTDDELFGTAAADTIRGLEGDDVILADEGNDTVLGGIGDDLIDGGAGNDLLVGGAGSDEIYGGEGNDRLRGGTGDDYLEGGAGDDVLSGGGGADTFAYSDRDSGNDTIRDFNPLEDTLDLRSVTGLTFDELEFKDTNAGVLITAKDPSLFSGSILLRGVSASELNDQNLLTATPCFLRGTMLATPEGERAVETLAIGDLVMTLDGMARPVKWIGRRSFRRRFVGRDSEANPVLFRAGCIGPTTPSRDLAVSGMHAMFFDGVFVRAEDLVNGTTVTRDTTCELIEYFHVELDTPDVVFANGAPTETYANHDSRRMFTNWQEYVDLYGCEDALEPGADGEFERPFPLVTEGEALEAVRRSLAPGEPALLAA